MAESFAGTERLRLIVACLIAALTSACGGSSRPQERVEPQVDFEFQESVRQGEIVRIAAWGAPETLEGATAELGDRSVPFFPQADGEYLGLVPVAATEPPGTRVIRVRSESGEVLRSLPVEILDANFPRQNIRVTARMRALEAQPGEMEAVRELRNTVSEERFWEEPFHSPVPHCMNSVFGVMRLHNGEFTGNYHRGVDLRSPTGTPVQAVTAGVVRISRMFGLHGGTVGLDHGHGVVSMYIHLSKLEVEEGQRVDAGEMVGRVGATGFATGPHLHWGLYVHGVPVNPDQWIPDVPRCE